MPKRARLKRLFTHFPSGEPIPSGLRKELLAELKRVKRKNKKG